MNPFTDKRTRIYSENRYNSYERTIQNTQLMYIFNGPIGYDELTGTIYINPESVDGFVVAQTEPGLSEDEAREAIGRVLSQICG
jgi:hypothetical protein